MIWTGTHKGSHQRDCRRFSWLMVVTLCPTWLDVPTLSKHFMLFKYHVHTLWMTVSEDSSHLISPQTSQKPRKNIGEAEYWRQAILQHQCIYRPVSGNTMKLYKDPTQVVQTLLQLDNYQFLQQTATACDRCPRFYCPWWKYLQEQTWPPKA